ncbi:MAG: glutamate--tRNA ligase [Alphaproteobacteria bacterium]
MSVVVRFAPSPTGLLHFGNLRTAVLNWLFARKAGGRFVLRLDDTDTARSTEEFAKAILDDLAWVGLDHDQLVVQSARTEHYTKAAEKLKQAGRLYPCFESPQELERKRKRQLARGVPPVYDREGLALSQGDRAALEASGRRPHWRFKLERRKVAWDDLVRGQQNVDCASLSDPVLVREDASFLYTLPSVVDDVEFGISHVVRGEDHVTNTAPQIQLFEALGATAPRFGHHSLLVAGDGARLSKRDGALSIGALRQAGLEAMSVVSLAATIGTSDPIAPFQTHQQIWQAFDFGKLSRAPGRFDAGDLRGLNAKLLHARDFAQVSAQLEALGIGASEALWNAVRANITILEDTREWWKIVASPITPQIGDEAAFCAQGADLLGPEPWDAGTWRAWTKQLAAQTGRKGRALFMPLRLALTGRDHGPEMTHLLPLIGRARALGRLGGNIS